MPTSAAVDMTTTRADFSVISFLFANYGLARKITTSRFFSHVRRYEDSAVNLEEKVW